MLEYSQFDCTSNEMVPMRDGVRLATDVYLPARNGEPLPGPWPAILIRTPYDKTRTSGSLGHGSGRTDGAVRLSSLRSGK